MARIHTRNEQGFTLIETMIALLVLTVGVLGMAQVMAFTLSMSSDSGAALIAHEKATEAIESVFTARDTRTISWALIRNQLGQSGNDGGVFKDGPQPLRTTGADGLVNTNDDGNVESIMQPGPDGQLGTADDVAMPLDLYRREITITNVIDPVTNLINPNLRRINVKIYYRAEQLPLAQRRPRFEIETFISAFA